MRRRILVLLASFAIALAVPLTAASPAQATYPIPDGCSSGYLCMYNFIQHRESDGVGKLTGSNKWLSHFPHSTCPEGTWNNCMSSVYNATTKCFHLHQGTEYTLGYHNLSPGDGFPDMGATTSLNNQVSSVKQGSSSSCNF